MTEQPVERMAGDSPTGGFDNATGRTGAPQMDDIVNRALKQNALRFARNVMARDLLTFEQKETELVEKSKSAFGPGELEGLTIERAACVGVQTYLSRRISDIEKEMD